jgi:hypothetical protein
MVTSIGVTSILSYWRLTGLGRPGETVLALATKCALLRPVARCVRVWIISGVPTVFFV